MSGLPESAEGRNQIDLATWERRAVFELFQAFEEPYHGVCLRVDCTETYRLAKQEHLSVFLSMVHRSLAAAQTIPNFRTRVEDGTVWQYDQIHAGSAVGRPNGTIGFGHYRYQSDLRNFVADASVEVERVKQRTDLERRPGFDLIRYSVLPWFDFTSVSHSRQFGRRDSAPYITFGKITETAGRHTLPVSIHVHHALIDGSQVAEFVQRFEAAMAAPEAPL